MNYHQVSGKNIENLEGIIVPPGCDNSMLKDSGEAVHTYTPASYTPYSPQNYPKKQPHQMSGKTDGITIPKNPTPFVERSMTEYLQQFQGAHVCMDLWLSPHNKIKKCGILLEIGKDFLVMQDTAQQKLCLIDLKPICFLNIYCK